MLKSLLIVLLITSSSFAEEVCGQEREYHTADELQREVTLLLLEKNINEVTKQLENEPALTVPSLLRRQSFTVELDNSHA